jgi:hypothetical protein
MKTHTPRFQPHVHALLTGAALTLLAATPMSSSAVIHEIVAAYCSGGGTGAIDEHGELVPPGLISEQAFARPVIASGAVGPGLLITDKPNTKFPAGTSVFAAVPSASNHPSAAHCVNVADLP